MSLAHPWLEQEPWPTQQMPLDMLMNRIDRVLTLTNIGYLGTAAKDGSPIVSPVEFYNEGLSVYFFPQPNSPKLRAMQRKPRVAMAIANRIRTPPMVGVPFLVRRCDGGPSSLIGWPSLWSDLRMDATPSCTAVFTSCPQACMIPTSWPR